MLHVKCHLHVLLLSFYLLLRSYAKTDRAHISNRVKVKCRGRRKQFEAAGAAAKKGHILNDYKNHELLRH